MMRLLDLQGQVIKSRLYKCDEPELKCTEREVCLVGCDAVESFGNQATFRNKVTSIGKVGQAGSL
jgi:hypothetical protein